MYILFDFLDKFFFFLYNIFFINFFFLSFPIHLLIFFFLTGNIFFCFYSNNRFYLLLNSFFTSSYAFYSYLIMLINHKFYTNNVTFDFIEVYSINTSFIDINLIWGIDILSNLFLILTTFLICLCVLLISLEKNLKFFLINLLIIELFLIIVFSTLNLLIFYIFFEGILIPMFLIVGIWGSRDRKIWAIYLLFFYTLCSSLCFLISILYINFIYNTLDISQLASETFPLYIQYWLWLAFFLSFASKIPVFPLHLWLPEAHVEAPTVGSILLAGILLKLGVYGFIRFNLTFFLEASQFFTPFIYLLCILGILYSSFSAIRQTDIKRIIAYSSVAHMNLICIGIFSFTNMSIEGVILQSISHGFVSGGLFFLIGVLYSRYGSRQLNYYSGINEIMPFFSFFFFFFTLGNLAFPGTSSFVGEFLILTSIYINSPILCIITTFSIVLCGSYSLWLYNRIFFGNINSNIINYMDLNFNEFIIASIFFLFILILGLFPSILFYYL